MITTINNPILAHLFIFVCGIIIGYFMYELFSRETMDKINDKTSLWWAKFRKETDGDVKIEHLRADEKRYFIGDFHQPEKVLYCSISNCTCYFCNKHRKQNINLN